MQDYTDQERNFLDELKAIMESEDIKGLVDRVQVEYPNAEDIPKHITDDIKKIIDESKGGIDALVDLAKAEVEEEIARMYDKSKAEAIGGLTEEYLKNAKEVIENPVLIDTEEVPEENSGALKS